MSLPPGSAHLGPEPQPQIKNPHGAQALEHQLPEQLVAEIMEKERRILELMAEIEGEP